MVALILAALNAIPGIGAIVSNITAAFFNAKVQIVQAKTGADRDVAVAMVKAAATEAHARTEALSVIASNYLLTILVIAFALPLVIYEWRVIVFDNVLGYGATWGKADPIGGQVGDWANLIIGFIFGAPTALTVGKMWFARKST